MFQALAILPGVSRSGATIVAGLWFGLSPLDAITFSFFLAIPAIFGASILEVSKIFHQSGQLGLGILGMVISAAVSLLALAVLEKVMKSKKLFLFGWYCLILGFLVLKLFGFSGS